MSSRRDIAAGEPGHDIGRAARREPIACPPMAVGCFVSTGRSLDRAIERVRLAESLGYEAAM